MGFYSPPLNKSLDVRLSAGYIKPVADAQSHILSSLGEYLYKPSYFKTVDARLSAGYIKPVADAQSHLLLRPKGNSGSAETQNAIVESFGETHFGNARFKNRWYFTYAEGFQHDELGTPKIRNASEILRPVYSTLPFYDTVLIPYVSGPFADSYTLVARPNYMTQFGSTEIYNFFKEVYVKAWEAATYGRPVVILGSRRITTQGDDCSEFGYPEVADNSLHPEGIAEFGYGEPEIYNFTQYLPIEGVEVTEFGELWVLGGVQTLNLNGFEPEQWGEAEIINTLGEQYIGPEGIQPFDLAEPKVTPQIIFVSPIMNLMFGDHLVQRNPSPNGFVTSLFGTNWISHNPRYITPEKIDGYVSGYGKVFDPTQTVYQQLALISTAVIGDVRIYNLNKYVQAKSFDAAEVNVWVTVESNRRPIVVKGNEPFTLFGGSQVYNKTPNLSPESISGVMGEPGIGYHIRYLTLPGFDQYGVGRPLFTLTPSIDFTGIDAAIFGEQVVTHHTRTLEVVGVIGEDYGIQTVWNRLRKITVSGIGKEDEWGEGDGIGRSFVEFSYREVITRGDEQDEHGIPRVSYRIQRVIVDPYTDQKFSNHIVGGTQWLRPDGYVASLFGTRVIPEAQTLYTIGASGYLGWPDVQLLTHRVDLMGFSSENILPFGRWGTAKLWNLRQYVKMYYDPDSLLNEPKNNSKWTAIENRSRKISTFGQAHHAMGRPGVENKATPLLAQSAAMDQYGSAMIAYRIRHLLATPIEPEYMSSWSVIHNDARVIAHASFSYEAIGKPLFKNTRRYFDFQGLDHSEFGHPMISDRIRELTIENRHTISPPYIDLPKIELSTRYMEPATINQERFGSADFTIYQARIISGWVHVDRAGSPEIRNLTPELRFWGRPSDEFGEPYLRSSKAYYNHIGNDTSLIPKPLIEFKNRSIFTSGFNNAFFGSDLNIIKIGTAPYGVQYIWLDSLEDNDNDTGYGIGIPGSNYPGGEESGDAQVPKPAFNQWHIQHYSSTDTAKYGKPTVSANSIRVEPGIQEFAIGEHIVGLRHRSVQVSSIESTVKLGKPGLSPQTIWAPAEAPEQAVSNHKGTGSGGYVNIDGIVMGRPTISQYHGRIAIEGDVHSRISEPAISLLKVYIHIDGINSLRFGWHELPEWEHTVESSSIGDQLIFGGSEIGHRWEGSLQNISPKGMYSFETEYSQIDNLHRVVKPEGFESIEFGESVSGDFEYYPQSLHIGFKKPVIPTGTETTEHGLSWISHKVRQVEVQGFDNFISTYTTSKFKDRIQVKLKTKPQAVLSQTVAAEGFDSSVLDWQNIKLKVHYIRPDGNSDQFRMGGIQ